MEDAAAAVQRTRPLEDVEYGACRPHGVDGEDLAVFACGGHTDSLECGDLQLLGTLGDVLRREVEADLAHVVRLADQRHDLVDVGGAQTSVGDPPGVSADRSTHVGCRARRVANESVA